MPELPIPAQARADLVYGTTKIMLGFLAVLETSPDGNALVVVQVLGAVLGCVARTHSEPDKTVADVLTPARAIIAAGPAPETTDNRR